MYDLNDRQGMSQMVLAMMEEQKRKRLAQILGGMGQNIPSKGQMLGNVYVPPSWTQQLSGAANTMLNAYQASRPSAYEDIMKQWANGTQSQSPMPDVQSGMDGSYGDGMPSWAQVAGPAGDTAQTYPVGNPMEGITETQVPPSGPGVPPQALANSLKKGGGAAPPPPGPYQNPDWNQDPKKAEGVTDTEQLAVGNSVTPQALSRSIQGQSVPPVVQEVLSVPPQQVPQKLNSLSDNDKMVFLMALSSMGEEGSSAARLLSGLMMQDNKNEFITAKDGETIYQKVNGKLVPVANPSSGPKVSKTADFGGFTREYLSDNTYRDVPKTPVPMNEKQTLEAKTEKDARHSQIKNTIANANLTIGKMEELISSPRLDAALGTWGRVKGVMGDLTKMPSDFGSFVADIKTVASRLWLEYYQQIKAASPSGSTGLGALTEKEGAHLQSQYGAIEEAIKGKTPEEIQTFLRTMVNDYKASIGRVVDQARKEGIAFDDASPNSQQSKVIAASRVEQEAAKRGVTPEQMKQQLEAMGYSVQ